MTNVPRMLDTVRERFNIKSDAALARELDIAPSAVCKARANGADGRVRGHPHRELLEDRCSTWCGCTCRDRRREMTALNEDQFLKEVAGHSMTVIRDDGIYRHLRFKRPDTICMHFDLITWPSYLCYTGDMGTYVFTRLTDMFEFFRTDREYAARRGRKLAINLSYWSEKLTAVDGSRSGGSAKEFDESKFREVINSYLVGWVRSAKESGSLDKDGRRELWKAVEQEVLGQLEYGEQAAYTAANEFSYPPGRYWPEKPTWQFTDLFEHDFSEYTQRMVWCCYALAWGIQQYDEAKAAADRDPRVPDMFEVPA
jgi:hypothetical protein